MLQLHLTNLIYLALLLAPGIIAGSIVTYHTKSAPAIFKTILASLGVSFLMGAVTILLGKLLAPFLSATLGGFFILIDFSPSPANEFAWFGSLQNYVMQCYRYMIIAPIGTVAGAALSGMLLVVSYKLKRKSTKFDSSLGIIATIATTLLGGFLSLTSILSVSLLSGLGMHFTIKIFGDGFLSTAQGLYTFYGAWVLLVLINSLLCGFTSAFFGMKVARILT